MSRIIGVQSLYLAKLKKDVAGSAPSYEEPFAVPSLTALEINDNSEQTTWYSDDTIEQVLPTFAGKEVSIELGYLSNELEAKIMGYEYRDGVITQTTDATAPEFAMMFKAPKSKGGFQYVCLYRGVLAKSESSYKTKEDNIESSGAKLEGKFMALSSNGKVAIKVDTDQELEPATQELVTNWFKTVPVQADAEMRVAKTTK